MLKFSTDEVCYLDIVFHHEENSNEFIAGATFKRRTKEDYSRFETLKVASIYVNDEYFDSIRKFIIHVLYSLLGELPETTKHVVVASPNVYFQRPFELKRKVAPKLTELNCSIQFKRNTKLLNINRDLLTLANDGLQRKGTVIADV